MPKQRTSITPPVARPKADVVFCIDATSSMGPCIDAVRDSIDHFVEGIQSAENVDYRLRLIGYRDLHVDIPNRIPFSLFDFTGDIDEFRRQLSTLQACCNQPSRGAESALDGLYLAATSPWRTSRVHRTVVFVTDDDTHPSLAEETYPYPARDKGADVVAAELQKMSHLLLYARCPDYSAYQALGRAVQTAERRFIHDQIPRFEDDREACYERLNDRTDWAQVLLLLGKVVSQTCSTMAEAS